ncbi:MAG TPA: phosphonate ABC transporter, permease protein PhnE, partial [Microbacteriaceae bacterium]|nr:phosphonate ABC transporter, permease protein PhnE [Microbacteriaceae bacterium]
MSTATPERAQRSKQAPALTTDERERLEQAFRVPRARFVIGVVIGALVLVWSFVGAQFNFAKLGDGAVNMGAFLLRLFPPDFGKFDRIFALLIETLQMAIVGTFLGAVL